MHKSEDLILEISKTTQTLFQTVGVIRVLFKESPELKAISNDIYNYKTINIEQRPQDNWSLKQLEDWKLKAVSNVQRLVEVIISEPIKKLTIYLEKELQEGQ